MGRKEKVVVVHPGSGSKSKCWPLGHFFSIMHRFASKGIKGVIVTGTAEAGIEREMEKAFLPRTWAWIKNPPLLRLAGLLSCSSFYLGNDSGITHLAASCGTPGLALFRDDLKAAWRPFGSISVLSGEPLSEIRTDLVWDAISEKFSVLNE